MAKIRVTRSLVPNLLTLVNLFCGFAAIVYASEGLFTKASIFVLMAAVFDMLDGLTARLIKAASEFGAELDSLCDIVSFGVAPSYILYQSFFFNFHEFGILFASFPALAGASRLARFNVQLTSLEDKLYFKGLPIPAAALTLLSYLVFFHNNNFLPDSYKGIVIFIVVAVVSISMVSTIKFDNLPKPNIASFKQRPVVSIIFLIALIISIITKGYGIFPVLAFYIIGSFVRHIFILYNNRPEPDDDIDVDESEDNYNKFFN